MTILVRTRSLHRCWLWAEFALVSVSMQVRKAVPVPMPVPMLWAGAGSQVPASSGRAVAEPMPRGAGSASTPGRAEPEPRGSSPGPAALGDGRQRAPHGLPAAGTAASWQGALRSNCQAINNGIGFMAPGRSTRLSSKK